MEANITEYLIMGISSLYQPEKQLAVSLNNDHQYCLISISEVCAKKCEAIDNDVIFILINPDYDVSDDFTTQLGNRCQSKKVIFYLHNRDIENKNLKKIISGVESECTDIQKIKFSHENSDPKYGPYKKILENIASDIHNYSTFKGHIETLITESLNLKNTPHLIALSILCQGYLAAHEGNGLNGWDSKFSSMLVSDAKIKTENIAWWTETIDIKEAEKELSDKGNGEVKALLSALSKKEIIWDNVTQLVIEANKALPKILQEKG